MQGAPVGNLAAQLAIFGFQCLRAFLLGLEFGAQLHQPRAHGLQFLIGGRFGIARLFDGLIQLLLPLLGAGVFAEQLREFLLAGLLLVGEGGELLPGGFQLLEASELAVLFFLQRLLALLLFAEFIALLIELFQPLGDLPVQLHEGRGRFVAQALAAYRPGAGC